jgi:Zn-dependent peptidase ImmA (M78 family)/transcriptional regulator with XRE-family HTH domain
MADTLLAQRLKMAREAVGLTLGEAAAKLGFANYQTLSNIEKGEREVKASELVALAKAYFCDLSRLLMGDSTPEREVHFLWRKAPAIDKKAEIEADIRHRLEHYHLLEQLLGIEQEGSPLLIKAAPSDVRFNTQVDNLAARVGNMLDLGSRPALALQKIMEQVLRTKILFIHLSDFGSAASTVHPTFGAAIVVNDEEAPWRINFTLAHELFHILTWDAFPADDMQQNDSHFRDVEKKADRFASTLLLPESEVRQELSDRMAGQRLSFSDIVDVAHEFGVSTQALLYRMANMHLIAWERADAAAHDEELILLDRRVRRDARYDAPESQRFILLAAKCLRKGLISRGKFAELLEIDRSDIDEYLEYRGFTETEDISFEIMVA